MDQIIFILLFFSLLFLIETKAINILICFIGIILSVAIKLSNLKELILIQGQYFSYILILVQISALTILFGFIIMLYPTLSNNSLNLNPRYKNIILIFLIIGIFIFCIINTNENNLKIEDLDKIDLESNTQFLQKLGILLYSNDNTIFKLIVLTLILLLAIIALFFIVSF